MGHLSQKFGIAALLASVPLTHTIAQTPPIQWRQFSFNTTGGLTVNAELGEIRVLARRAIPGGPTLPLQFARFRTRSLNPGPPIVYLAGGPGGSGIAAAAGARWPIFDMLRDVSDVIALDQRGTGRAYDLPRCTTGALVPHGEASTREMLSNALTSQVRHCRRFWDSAGVDLAAFTTAESADDLEDLRRALGVDQLNLWGISYGTHLAFAALKRHPASFHRSVLISPEGLDETAKLPRSTDAYFARVAQAIAADSVARAIYPDVEAMMRRVVAAARARPIKVRATVAGDSADLVLGDFELQRLAADRLADPAGTATVLAAFSRADRGDYSVLASWAQRTTGQPIFLSAMPLAMDAASGISDARRATIAAQAPTAILGDALGWPVLHANAALADLDMGETFRAPFRSDHEVLIISGTLDGRTYPESHRQLAEQFFRSVFIPVENGGHNTSLASSEVQRRMRLFFSGESVPVDTVRLAPPRWAP